MGAAIFLLTVTSKPDAHPLAQYLAVAKKFGNRKIMFPLKI